MKDQFKDNFDFEHHKLNQPQKEEEETFQNNETQEQAKEDEPKEESEEPNSKYDACLDFFDHISNSTNANKGMDYNQRDNIRKRDADTFGF